MMKSGPGLVIALRCLAALALRAFSDCACFDGGSHIDTGGWAARAGALSTHGVGKTGVK